MWSPYYRISVEPLASVREPGSSRLVEFGETVGRVLTVNNDYHQMMLDLRPRESEHAFLSGWRAFYDAPYAAYDGFRPCRRATCWWWARAPATTWPRRCGAPTGT